MGFIDFLKKKTAVKQDQPTAKAEPQAEMNNFGERWDELTKDGDLPTGWLYRNKSFVDQAEADYSHFLNWWLDSRNKSPREQYPTLKSFVLFLEGMERECKRKGVCFEFWFHELIASTDYIEKRKSELHDLTVNLESLQKEYETKAMEDELRKKRVIEMRDDVIALLKENAGILQSDFWKLFDDKIEREAATEIYYSLLNDGKIERVKSGRSYKISYKD